MKKNNKNIDGLLNEVKDISLSSEEKHLIKHNLLSFIEANPGDSNVCPWIISGSHVAQLYRDKNFMKKAVACWIGESLMNGGGAILISSKDNSMLVKEELENHGIEVNLLEATGRLCIVDAESLMSWFILGGTPNEETFMHLTKALVRRVRRACGDPKAEVRAWGEMVNILLKAGNLQGAKKMELLLHDFINNENVRRMCSYHIDNLSAETYDILPHLCAGHSQLLPEEDEIKFEKALAKVMTEIFGAAEYARMWKKFAKNPLLSTKMPQSEAVLLGLRAENPTIVEQILAKVRLNLNA